ncbi:uncharacterized protein LOC135168887 [Diachasmimorpha longicaudata]|uniref:uncharacterized protein LOC135168887 n=1 Tax=Diachasmimorpha longicaudata TaxID=58733 RepID=UPI0030B8B3E4
MEYSGRTNRGLISLLSRRTVGCWSLKDVFSLRGAISTVLYWHRGGKRAPGGLRTRNATPWLYSVRDWSLSRSPSSLFVGRTIENPNPAQSSNVSDKEMKKLLH